MLGQVAQGRGKLTLHVAQCDAPTDVTPPTDIWPALEKIMEIPGFTEHSVDDRPPNVPDSPDHPL